VIENPGAEESTAPASTAPATPRISQPSREPLVAIGSKQFEAIRALLARHIGPIAKVLVEKAAKEAGTPDEFCERLAANVTAPADRAAFVQAVKAQLVAKS
jgi:eukaryotic-like serine/threonine-protein kinase